MVGFVEGLIVVQLRLCGYVAVVSWQHGQLIAVTFRDLPSLSELLH